MTFTDFIYATGDFLESTFTILPKIGNSFNYAVIVLGLVGLAYWLLLQKKLTKKAREENKLI
jgi:hypothetical protein